MYFQIENFKEFKRQFKKAKVRSFSKQGLKALYNYSKDYENKTKIEVRCSPKSFKDEWTEVHVNLALIIQNVESLSELEAETIVISIPGSQNIVYLKY